MDAKARSLVVLFLTGSLFAGCQSTANSAKNEREDSLRNFAATNGIALKPGSVDIDKLAAAMKSKGESQADEIIREAKSHDDGTPAGFVLFQKVIARKMAAADKACQRITSNIANEFTPGYRASIAGSETEHDMQQGVTMTTHRQMDIAIQGEGFLMFKNPDTGKLIYTRDGSLGLNGNSQLVAGANGTMLLNPPITFPTGVLRTEITRDGRLKVQTPGSSIPTDIGQIQLATFPSPQKLATQDGIHFTETTESGAPIISNPGSSQAGTLQHQCLEASNVEKEPEMLTYIRYSACYVKLSAALKPK